MAVVRELNWNRAASCGAPAPGVEEALLEGLRAGSPGRGTKDGGAGERRLAARARLARLLGFGHPQRLVYCSGATYALNQALHGCVRPGETVLTTRLEHNAVLRPLEALAQRGCTVLQAGFDPRGFVRLDQLEQMLVEARPAWVVACLGSNVLGTLQPLAEIARLARAHGARVIADLAQGAGQVAVDFDAWGLSLAAVPAHKGIGGPRGIGALLVGADVDPEPLVLGGTGVQGHLRQMPPELPTRLEAGTPNLPGIYAFDAAVRWLERSPPDLAPVRRRLEALEATLREDPAWQVFPAEPGPWHRRLPVLALAPNEVPVSVLASLLAQHGVHARGGLQCAPDVCADLGAPRGVLRLSPPLDASDEDFARVLTALRQARATLA